MSFEARKLEGNCPAFAYCKAVQRCIYQCHKDKEHARYLYHQEVVENFRTGRSNEPSLLKVTSVAAEHRAEARIAIIKARVATYSFLLGVGVTLLGCWLFTK